MHLLLPGIFLIKLAKVKQGEVFEGLELLTKILSPAKRTVAATPVIEVIPDADGNLFCLLNWYFLRITSLFHFNK